MGEALVLIVDDEPMLRTLFARVLDREAIAYRTASSLATARQALAAEEFALVVLDRSLGGENGLDLLPALCRPGDDIRTRAVVVSGELADGAEGIEGVDAYLTKPVTVDAFVSCVQSQLASYEATRLRDR